MSFLMQTTTPAEGARDEWHVYAGSLVEGSFVVANLSEDKDIR